MTRTINCAVAACLVSLFLLLSTISTVHGRDGDAHDILTDPVANRRAVFESIYEDAGYSSRDAETLATRALTRIAGYEARVFEAADLVDAEATLSPDADPLALFQHHLMAHGFDGHAAAAEAGKLWVVLQPGFQGDENDAVLGTGCVFYTAVVIYCEPDELGVPRKKWSTIRIDSNCYEMNILPLIPTQLPVCPWDERRYFMIGVHCGGINANVTGIRDIYGPFEGSCDGVMGCECFDLPAEGPLRSMCCPDKGGCAGCPENWTW